MKTFGNAAIGIHGKELPKFSDSDAAVEYWKKAGAYCENPPTNSYLMARQTQKYWAKPDDILLADAHEASPPLDPFKQTHVSKQPKVDISEKVQRINHFQNEEKEVVCSGSMGPLSSRWTEVVHYFAQKPSAYEEDPTMRKSLLRYEDLPLPSSFNERGVFEDPLTKYKVKPKPQTTELKPGKQSMRATRGAKEQHYKPPKENLLLRVTSKKSIAPAEVDMRRTVCSLKTNITKIGYIWNKNRRIWKQLRKPKMIKHLFLHQ